MSDASLLVLVAALGGAAIGVERQQSGHASGIDARFGGVRTFTFLAGERRRCDLCAALTEKCRLHALVARIDDDELGAGARFGVMAIVALPLQGREITRCGTYSLYDRRHNGSTRSERSLTYGTG